MSASLQTVNSPPLVFSGNSVDDHVEAWREVESGIESDLWRLAAIAASITDDTQYGARDVASFAEQIGRTQRRIYQLASAYREFGNGSRLPNLPFEHHVIAACAPEPKKALKAAVDNNLDRQSFRIWVSIQKRKDSPVIQINNKRQRRANEAIDKLQAWCEEFPEFAHHQEQVMQIIEKDAASTPETDRQLVLSAIKEHCRKVCDVQEYTDNMLSVSRIHHAIDALMSEEKIGERAPAQREGNKHNKEREYYPL